MRPALLALVAAACTADGFVAPAISTPVAPHASSAVAAARPNVLLFVLDDATKRDMDDRALTPEMHRWVADVGLAFERYYANSALCSTARATILSLLYQHNHHVMANTGAQGGARAFRDATTIATALGGVGYAPIILGKYLNEIDRLSGGDSVPPGWWHWQIMNLNASTPGLAMRYWNWGEAYRPGWSSAKTSTKIAHGTTPAEWQPRYISSRLGPALAQLPAATPFFALVAPLGPHAPAKPEAQDVGKCDARPLYRPVSFNELDVSDQPLRIRQSKAPMGAAKIAAIDSSMRVACETLIGTDRAFGAMMQDLAASGRLGNTCVAVITDQGIQNGEHRLDYKSVLYDETVHGPLWIRCPGLAPRVDSTHVVSTVDLMATVLDLAGWPNAIPHNGTSLLPIFANATAPGYTEALLENPDQTSAVNRAWAVVTAQWKYMLFGNGDEALYGADSPEDVNLAKLPAYAAQKSTLAARLAQLRAQ